MNVRDVIMGMDTVFCHSNITRLLFVPQDDDAKRIVFDAMEEVQTKQFFNVKQVPDTVQDLIVCGIQIADLETLELFVFQK